MSGKIKRALATREYRVYLAGLAVMLFHLCEDALVHKENGSSLAAQLGSTGLTLVLVGAGAVLYPLIWPWGRPVLVLFFGLLALSGGAQAHLPDALNGEAAGGDYTGVLYALAGAVLIGLAVKLAADLWRGRPEPATPRG